MRKELGRPFPTRNTGRAGEASSTRATRGGRLYAPPCRFHKGSGAGPGAENALSFFPDAEFAELRRPRSPRTGNSPRAPNASAAPAEIQGAERAGGRSAIKWKARGRSSAADAVVRGVRMPMRMRGTRNARYLQTLPQPYSYAAYLTQPYSYADIATAAISPCRIFLCSYSTQTFSTAAYLLHIMTTVDITTVDILYCRMTLTSHTHNVLPTHLIPASLKVSHHASSLPP